MPERDAKLFEIVIGQMREYRDIDVIFDKALGVLGHAEVLEPVRNLLHAGCPCGLSNVTGPFDFFDKELIRQIPSVVGGGKNGERRTSGWLLSHPSGSIGLSTAPPLSAQSLKAPRLYTSP